ncbi:MAG: biopolymer transporter ExbD [Victivallaceae bacterium]|nr:biopolymer transporter ExbD [Victivallaceae bacterium]
MIQRGQGGRRYVTRLRMFTGFPELTALIDVMFLLLLFFYLSGSFVRVSGINVTLPKVRPTASLDMERHIITLCPVASNPDQAMIYFNDRQLDPESLKQELNLVRGRSRTATVAIRADRRVPHGRVAEIMAMAEQAGLGCFIVVGGPDAKGGVVFTE